MSKLKISSFQVENIASMVTWLSVSAEELFHLSSSFAYPLTAEDFGSYYDSVNSDSHRFYSVYTPNQENYIGHFEIKNISMKHKNGTGAHIIISPEYRKKGLGVAMIQALSEICFNDLGLERIGLSVHTVNSKAISCYIKAGFQVEGLIRNVLEFAGSRHSLYQMSLLKSDLPIKS